MGAIGTITPDIVGQVKKLFESRCVEMLEWACRELKANKKIDADWGEENITANIYVLVHESQKSIDYDIHPECEHPFFNQAILDNKKKAKSAPRIDLVFQYNWSGQRFSFNVEAKNLIENDVLKTGRKRKTKSSSVLKRYIETGIDHYLAGYYPQGCILGYVLNGTIVGVVNKLNAMLIQVGRGAEVLDNTFGASPWMSFQSQHTGKGMQITHYLFDFN